MTAELTLRSLQEQIDSWISTYGVRYFSELTNLAVLVEEVGELSRIMARQFGDQSPKRNLSGADLADELADILFVLVCIANQTGIDLTAAVAANLRKKTRRDHTRHHQNPKLTR
jgi:NTP pyrophosphatase (non-canonical NTP hydrolase)